VNDQRRDGGAAFPRRGSEGGGNFEHQEGMSLRDYFAAQALPAVIDFESAADSGGGARCMFSAATVAKGAYAIADAMLAERAK